MKTLTGEIGFWKERDLVSLVTLIAGAVVFDFIEFIEELSPIPVFIGFLIFYLIFSSSDHTKDSGSN